MSHRRARVGLVATAVAAGLVAPAVLVPPVASGDAGATAATGPSVTLLTGDRVVVGGPGGVVVHAAKGREHLSFYSHKDEHGDTHVVPEDAVALLSKGKLDPRLFDVTELARIGYDDASLDRLPLIVDHPGRTPRIAGVQVGRELPGLSAAAVAVDRSATAWPSLRSAEHVWLDGPVLASLDHSVPQIGAPEAWAAGHTGAGATVAVLDSGIDARHPDLSDAIAGEQNFSDSDTTDDRYGHGTHVASTITGNGAASGGRYRGVAPDALVLNGKVLNDSGGGLESWVIAGVEWAAAHDADVVNMSFGSSWPSDGTDAMSQAINRFTAETGMLFVISAGNSGDLVGSPAAADAALTVGAVDRDDDLAGFSSRGRLDGALKPEVTAPGVDIVAARAANGQVGTPAADGYVSLSGTSMAAPHVAGAAAILAGQHRDWNADQLKSAIMGTARPNDALTVFQQGAGRVDVAKASAATVFASVGSLDIGTVQWPHDDDQPIASTLTYTNTGSEPVTLDLAADITGPNGSPAPQGMFTLAPARLTVPAGGQASATLTTDTKVDAADGQCGGVVTATGTEQSVRTPVVVTREVESYDVTVDFLDHNGAPTDVYTYRFVDVHNPKAYFPYDPSGSVVVRLPRGEFYLEAIVQTQKSEYDYLDAHFVEPAFEVTGDASLSLDARDAKPLGFAVDKPNARAGSGIFQFALRTDWGDTGIRSFVPGYEQITIRPATTSKKDRFTFRAEARMAEWNGSSFHGSPYLYSVRHTENGTVPRTLSWTFHNRDLAKVRSEYAVGSPGLTGVREQFLAFPLPATLTEYYSPDVPWEGLFFETTAPDAFPETYTMQVVPRTYKAGRTTTERWNFGVFSPSFPNVQDYHLASRYGDLVGFSVPLATDQGAGRLGLNTAVGSTTLLRDGQVVGEAPYAGGGSFDVPPESEEYTLRVAATRPGARLSTEISGEWTFTSGHVDGEDPVDLPLLAVRFAPGLDQNNAAPAGKRFTIPVSVEPYATDEVGDVHAPAVEVSYDDGRTWQTAKVGRDKGRWKATVDHPRDARFVSLRASVADRDGNANAVTVIRAYALA